MKKRRIASQRVEEPPPRTFSNCIVVGDQVFMSGLCSLGDDAYTQTKSIFDKMAHLMEAAGGTLADIVRFSVYVVDMNDRDQILKARAEFLEGDLPASTLVEVNKLVDPRFRVEIEATAVLGCGDHAPEEAK